MSSTLHRPAIRFSDLSSGGTSGHVGSSHNALHIGPARATPLWNKCSARATPLWNRHFTGLF